ncbi:MAG: MFS transporter, partial [Chloroflexota bacterium]
MTQPTRAYRTVVPVFAAGYFAMATASGMFAPALAALATAFSVSTGAAGQLGALAPLTWAVLAPFFGPWSDRLGRRTAAAGGLALMGAGSVVAAASPSIGWLVVSRVITGIGGAAFGPSVYALVADLFPPVRRAPVLGAVMAGFSAAALLGLPVVAYVTGWLGWRWAFGAVGALLLAIALALH